MKVSKDDFVRWSQDMMRTFHTWEVMMPFGKPGSLKIRNATFTLEEYPTPEDQYEAVCDLIRGCRFSDSEYYVFCDGRLVTNV